MTNSTKQSFFLDRSGYPSPEKPGRKSRFLLYGLGVSGLSVLRFLVKMGEEAYIYIDPAPGSEDQGPEERVQLPEEFKSYQDQIHILDQLPDRDLKSFDLLVKSPGIHLDRPVLVRAHALGLPVISDIEWAYRLVGGDKMVAITGSNGKTTTTALVSHLLNENGRPALACGNIGFPVFDGILASMKSGGLTSKGKVSLDKTLVVECSSYQLASVKTFAPHIAMVLNLSPDHLEYHGSYQNYITCKFQVGLGQGKEDYLFLNKKDKDSQAWIQDHPQPGQILWVDPSDDLSDHIRQLGSFPLYGDFNIENARFAYGLGRLLNLGLDEMDQAMGTFQPISHRMEFVKKVGGVTYINDSKGTNVGATVRALDSLHAPILLIAGGYDKQVTFDDLYQAFRPRGRWLIVLGETQAQIAKGAEAQGLGDRLVLVKNLKEAVHAASQLAQPGDIVLLSPACASWDQYKSYEERGDEFKDLVKGLAPRD